MASIQVLGLANTAILRERERERESKYSLLRFPNEKYKYIHRTIIPGLQQSVIGFVAHTDRDIQDKKHPFIHSIIFIAKSAFVLTLPLRCYMLFVSLVSIFQIWLTAAFTDVYS